MSAAYPSGAKIPEAEIERSRHHLFLCIGPDCCVPEAGQELWDVLKVETRRLEVPVLRTKAACLRICQGGLDSGRLRRILREHIEQGRPVDEWIVARSCQG